MNVDFRFDSLDECNKHWQSFTAKSLTRWLINLWSRISLIVYHSFAIVFLPWRHVSYHPAFCRPRSCSDSLLQQPMEECSIDIDRDHDRGSWSSTCWPNLWSKPLFYRFPPSSHPSYDWNLHSVFHSSSLFWQKQEKRTANHQRSNPSSLKPGFVNPYGTGLDRLFSLIYEWVKGKMSYGRSFLIQRIFYTFAASIQNMCIDHSRY